MAILPTTPTDGGWTLATAAPALAVSEIGVVGDVQW